jgi:hypothetical protein
MKTFGILLALILTSCGGTGSESTDDTETSDLVATNVLILGDSLTDASTAMGLRVAEPRPTAACDTIAFTDNCAAASTRSRDLGSSGCTRSIGTRTSTVFGITTLSFSSASACSNWFSGAPDNSFVSKTESGSYSQGAFGYKVLTYTTLDDVVAGRTISDSDLKDFSGTKRSGGTKITRLSLTTRSIAVAGVHRRGLRPSGDFGFWHTLYSDSDQSTTVTYAASKFTLNGATTLAHNRASQKFIVSFSNLAIEADRSCCYPVGGTLSLSSTEGSAIEVSFSESCGSVTIDGASATMPPCSGSSQTKSY